MYRRVILRCVGLVKSIDQVLEIMLESSCTLRLSACQASLLCLLINHLRRLHRSHFCPSGLALLQGSVARLHLARRLARRSFSLMLKSSSRGAMGRVASRTSAESVELDEDVEDVLSALERRR